MTSTRELDLRDFRRRLAAFARAVALVVLAVATAAPAAAQVGALKKKLRSATGTQPPAEQAAQPAAARAGAVETLVLDDEVVERLIAGLRAAKAEREAAAKEDTPYGRHVRAAAAYAEAKPKCDAAAQAWYQRLAADQSLMEKNNAYLEKMIAAQQKGDTVLQRAYADSMLAMQDPSCTVKEPVQASSYYDEKREVDTRAEQAQLKASGFDSRELGAVVDRAIAILEDAPPPDLSPSEQAAVEKREEELKRLMGREPPPAAAAAPAPKPAPAPAPPQPTGPTMTPGQKATTDCMARNSAKHEKEIARLGESVREAYESGNTPAAMAIADSIRQLQMAGCPGY
jgi:hypothetical protein